MRVKNKTTTQESDTAMFIPDEWAVSGVAMCKPPSITVKISNQPVDFTLTGRNEIRLTARLGVFPYWLSNKRSR